MKFLITILCIISSVNLYALIGIDTNRNMVKLKSIDFIGKNKLILYENVYSLKGGINGKYINVILEKGDNSTPDSTCVLTIYSSDSTRIPFHYYLNEKLEVRSSYRRFYYPDYNKWINSGPENENAISEVFVVDSNRRTSLVIPSFGTSTDYIITNEIGEVIWKDNNSFKMRPTFYNLSDLKEGKYHLKIMSCHTGGIIGFEIKYKKIKQN